MSTIKEYMENAYNRKLESEPKPERLAEVVKTSLEAELGEWTELLDILKRRSELKPPMSEERVLEFFREGLLSARRRTLAAIKQFFNE